MGETADQIRDQVDSAREQATDKIIQLEQHVTDAAQQVKENLDWRHQVSERPLLAVGVALAGGALFASVTKGGNGQSRSYEGSSNHSSSSSSGNGGLGGVIRKAAQTAGLEAKIESAAQSFFTSLSKRVGEVATEAFSSPSPSPSASAAQPPTPTGRVSVSTP